MGLIEITFYCLQKESNEISYNLIVHTLPPLQNHLQRVNILAGQNRDFIFLSLAPSTAPQIERE